MADSVQTAVLGVSGYAGMELARLLLHHPRLKGRAPVFLGRADASEDASLTALHPQLMDNNGSAALKIEPFSWDMLKQRGVDILFLATPHEQSREYAPAALEHGIRVIDLSGAWRLTESANRAIYKFLDECAPTAVQVQAKSVYGIPELHRDAIRAAELVANPGCYATSVILALKPLLTAGWVDLDRGIVSDAKSGVSGAGKAPTAKTHYMHAADNLSAYAVFAHRHTGELLEQLDLDRSQIIFAPHLLPIPRGILATTYVSFKRSAPQPRSTRSTATSMPRARWSASSAPATCRRFNIPCAPTTAISASNSTAMAADASSCPASITCQGCSRASCSEPEPDVRMARSGGLT